MIYQGQERFVYDYKDELWRLNSYHSISPRYLKAKADFYPHTVALLSDFYFLLNSFLVMPQSNK